MEGKWKSPEYGGQRLVGGLELFEGLSFVFISLRFSFATGIGIAVAVAIYEMTLKQCCVAGFFCPRFHSL